MARRSLSAFVLLCLRQKDSYEFQPSLDHQVMMIRALGLLLGVAGASGFVIGSSPGIVPPRRGAAARAQPRMQVRQWVDVAAEQQGRDPARLAPLKPLPDCLVVRELEKPVFGEGGLEFAGGLLGVGQKVSPGNYGPDMNKVKQLCVDVGGYGAKELFEMNFLGQGFRSYVLAEDTRTGEVVGCAQLTRVQVGGYLYLTDDLQIDRVFVKEEYRRIGLANHMINALLQRVKPSQRAWMFADKDTPAYMTAFASGFVAINYSACGRVFPLFLWALLWPFHIQGLTKPNGIFFAAEGRGGVDAVNIAG